MILHLLLIVQITLRWGLLNCAPCLLVLQKDLRASNLNSATPQLLPLYSAAVLRLYYELGWCMLLLMLLVLLRKLLRSDAARRH